MSRRPAFKFRPVEYLIRLRSLGYIAVNGFAVQMPPPLAALRLCARKGGVRHWVIDHYDSGLSIGGPVFRIDATPEAMEYSRRWSFDRSSRDAVVRSAYRYLMHLRRNGELGQLLIDHGQPSVARELVLA